MMALFNNVVVLARASALRPPDILDGAAQTRIEPVRAQSIANAPARATLPPATADEADKRPSSR
ncbi:MAG: hypothetical protein H6651_13445 [Ardenticatenales bacterium]|nr:hypothetical protein [Ardenticatenales bacterium]